MQENFSTTHTRQGQTPAPGWCCSRSKTTEPLLGPGLAPFTRAAAPSKRQSPLHSAVWAYSEATFTTKSCQVELNRVGNCAMELTRKLLGKFYKHRRISRPEKKRAVEKKQAMCIFKFFCMQRFFFFLCVMGRLSNPHVWLLSWRADSTHIYRNSTCRPLQFTKTLSDALSHYIISTSSYRYSQYHYFIVRRGKNSLDFYKYKPQATGSDSKLQIWNSKQGYLPSKFPFHSLLCELYVFCIHFWF